VRYFKIVKEHFNEARAFVAQVNINITGLSYLYRAGIKYSFVGNIRAGFPGGGGYLLMKARLVFVPTIGLVVYEMGDMDGDRLVSGDNT